MPIHFNFFKWIAILGLPYSSQEGLKEKKAGHRVSFRTKPLSHHWRPVWVSTFANDFSRSAGCGYMVGNGGVSPLIVSRHKWCFFLWHVSGGFRVCCSRSVFILLFHQGIGTGGRPLFPNVSALTPFCMPSLWRCKSGIEMDCVKNDTNWTTRRSCKTEEVQQVVCEESVDIFTWFHCHWPSCYFEMEDFLSGFSPPQR